jgi:hypothetical protein
VGALKVIPPLSITDSTLTSSNVTENDYTAWSSGTTYALGDRVIITTPNIHKIYESLQASNTNKNPTTNPTWWIEVSATNRWKMFDLSNSTATEKADNIIVTITPGQVINGVTLLGLVAQTVRIKLTDPVEGVVYDETYNLNSYGSINNWYNYFFNPISRKTSVVVTDLPSYGSAVLEITITNTGSTAKCSVCVIGQVRFVGEGINLGASTGIQDYSRKEVDQWGNYQLIRRSYSKRVKFSMVVLNTQIDSLQELLADLRTTPCVWIGDPNYTSTIVYGFYKDFDILINYHTVSDCNLELEGLT